MKRRKLQYGLFAGALMLMFDGSMISAYAQDAQFSQQMASPLWINPAMSGADGYLRGAVNYRTQWNAVSDPFTTMAGSFDIAFNQRPDPRGPKKGKPGMGIAFLTDQTGDPAIRNTNVMLTGAYHVYLNKKSNLGAGLYVGYQSLSLDPESGKWGSQYNGMQYDPQLPHGEMLQARQQSALDVGGGLVYVFRQNASLRYDTKRRELKIGVAGYHVGRLMLSEAELFTDNDNMRFSGFANAAMGVGKSGSALEPAIYYHLQGPAQMLLAGMAYRHVFQSQQSVLRKSKPVSMALGCYYRFGDAVIATISFGWDALDLGLSYDVNVSNLSKYSSGQGAIEVSLCYRISALSFRR